MELGRGSLGCHGRQSELVGGRGIVDKWRCVEVCAFLHFVQRYHGCAYGELWTTSWTSQSVGNEALAYYLSSFCESM